MWRKVRTDVAAEIVSGGTPSRFVAEYWDGAIPWVTPTDISASRGKYLASTAERITGKGLSHSAAKLLPAGAVLLTSRATIGEARIAAMQVCTNQGFKSLVAREGFDPEFLYYQVCRQRGDYERYGVGSTFAEINKPDTSRVALLFPETEEKQQAIAGVLSVVDRLIDQTEALIAKQEQVRAGLMQDLFTRGVDSNGRLRPPREEAPELYHETELGWLPKGWFAKPLSTLANLQVGYAFKSGWFEIDGVRLLRGENVGHGSPQWHDIKYLSACRTQSFSEYLLKSGDLVIGMDRTFTGQGFKLTELSCDDVPALLVQRVGRFLYRDDDALYVRAILESDIYRRGLLALQKGMDIPHLSKAEILEPVIPIAPSEERKRIGTLERMSRKEIDSRTAEVKQVGALRLGLMRDLLTGEVPVDALLKERAAA